MNFRLMLSTIVFSLLVGTSSQAVIITSPTSLSLGDPYRLAFVTIGTRDATSSDIADYNSFVQSAADAVPELLSLGATWKAIASTASVDARDNTGTNPAGGAGVPIFLLNDTKLVDDNADLWDGSIDSVLNVTESGVEFSTSVWTGTRFAGEAHNFSELGATNIQVGISFSSGPGWIAEFIEFDPSLQKQLYAVSSVLTVVPEPSSFLLLGLAGIGVLGVARRRRHDVRRGRNTLERTLMLRPENERCEKLSGNSYARWPVSFVAAIFIIVVWSSHTFATFIQLNSTSQISGSTVPFDDGTTTANSQTIPFGVTTFPSNSFASPIGISGLFTGNVDAPFGPPRALSFGGTPGLTTYFHFAPLTNVEINAIGISATGAFTGQSTTFRVIVIDEDSNLLQYDTTMTPTGGGIGGLNGGAVFLGVQSDVPITTFRVIQLDDGFGILDNLRLDVTVIPEPSAFLLAALGLMGLLSFGFYARRRRKGIINGSQTGS